MALLCLDMDPLMRAVGEDIIISIDTMRDGIIDTRRDHRIIRIGPGGGVRLVTVVVMVGGDMGVVMTDTKY